METIKENGKRKVPVIAVDDRSFGRMSPKLSAKVLRIP